MLGLVRFSALLRVPCCAAPEAVFLQLARRLDMVSLVKLGMELCGTYSIYPAAQGGFRSREPLTSAAAIDRYLARICLQSAWSCIVRFWDRRIRFISICYYISSNKVEKVSAKHGVETRML